MHAGFRFWKRWFFTRAGQASRVPVRLIAGDEAAVFGFDADDAVHGKREWSGKFVVPGGATLPQLSRDRFERRICVCEIPGGMAIRDSGIAGPFRGPLRTAFGRLFAGRLCVRSCRLCGEGISLRSAPGMGKSGDFETRLPGVILSEAAERRSRRTPSRVPRRCPSGDRS